MHKTKTVKYKGYPVKIDVEIVSLLQNIWKLGIGTTNCCQAQCRFGCSHKAKECDSHVWIAFETCKDLEKFYNYVAEYDQNEKSIYAKMGADRCFTKNVFTKWSTPDDWGCLVIMRNHGVKMHVDEKRDMWVEDGCGKNRFIMEPQIDFPCKDLSYVEKRVKLAVAKLK